jgi:hypothetical protein
LYESFVCLLMPFFLSLFLLYSLSLSLMFLIDLCIYSLVFFLSLSLGKSSIIHSFLSLFQL